MYAAVEAIWLSGHNSRIARLCGSKVETLFDAMSNLIIVEDFVSIGGKIVGVLFGRSCDKG